MVTKTRKQTPAERKRKIKVDELRLNKETVKDLTGGEQNQIKGGRRGEGQTDYDTCNCLTYQNPHCYSSHTGCICG